MAWILTRGWINYFRIGSMKNKLHKIDEHLRTMIRVIIWKQWKTAKKREWGLLKLGVEKWIAHKVANWGNHYQLVATKSVVARAISKEILTKRGLISISDYYQRQHIFNFELNRRMPNGTYGGVRGRLNSPYSINLSLLSANCMYLVLHIC